MVSAEQFSGGKACIRENLFAWQVPEETIARAASIQWMTNDTVVDAMSEGNTLLWLNQLYHAKSV